MGHGSIRVTLDTYGHLFDGMDDAAADALDSAYRGVGPTSHTTFGLFGAQVDER
jgi:hypothetical protein